MNKTIDLTPIVGSQIMCQFQRNPLVRKLISPLMAIRKSDNDKKTPCYFPEYGGEYLNCRIYHHPDYWISNADGKLVLPDGVLINAMLRLGCIINQSPDWDLSRKDTDSDIIAVQVTGPSSGYQWGA